jgi:hypothetical protein
MKKRTTVWLPQELVERLKKLSRKTGAPMAELFRRAVRGLSQTPEVDVDYLKGIFTSWCSMGSHDDPRTLGRDYGIGVEEGGISGTCDAFSCFIVSTCWALASSRSQKNIATKAAASIQVARAPTASQLCTHSIVVSILPVCCSSRKARQIVSPNVASSPFGVASFAAGVRS